MPGVVHMTAFTYRFAPSMRYLRHLLKSGRSARRVISGRSDSSTGPRRAGAGGSTGPGPGRATCST